ncbi:MAG: hypothetical protein ACRDP6_42105 [Actinoallomurus sp.]
MALVRIVLDGLDAYVRSPFDAKDVIKSMPIRHWDAARKVWVIPADDVDELKAALEASGFNVIVTGEARRQERQRYEPPPRNSRTNGSSWADAMFVALGPELSVKAYKALSRALHPDLGGSTEHMQILNAARDRHGRH